MGTAVAAGGRTVEALYLRWRDSGDARALADLFDRTAPDLFRIALSVAPDAATAEESVQETFLAVLEDPGACDPSRPVMPWLAGVLRHKVQDARRRVRRVPDPLRLEPRILPEDPVDGASRREAVDRVRAAIDRLEEPYRTTALLRWEYGLEPGEIAHARGEPPGTVRSTLSRALERLRKALGGGAALALVLGVRPPDGLASIRRTVLAKAGAAVPAAGLLLGGVLVSRAAVAAALAAAFVAGGIAGGGILHALRPAASPAPAPPAASPGIVPEARPPSPAPAGSRPVRAEAPGAPPSAAAPADGARRRAHFLLDGLDGTWFTAWKVGGALAGMDPPEEGLEVLRARWAGLSRTVDRRNVMKGYAFSLCPLRLEVLDLGARDPDPGVREWASDYLLPYAGRRFDGDPAAYAAWREATAGASPEDLLALEADRLLGLLRSSPAEGREDLLLPLEDVVLRLAPGSAARSAVLGAAEEWIRDAAWLPDPALLLRVIRAVRPAGERARALFEDLLRRGPEGELRALLLAGTLDAPWAREALLGRIRSPDGGIAAAAAEALGDLGEPAALGPLVEALAARGEDRGAAGIAAALARLADVPGGEYRDASWWTAWWSRNRDRFEAPGPAEEDR